MQIDVLFRPGIITRFPPTVITNRVMGEGRSFKIPIALDAEEDMEFSPPTTLTHERPIEAPRLLRRVFFGRGIKNVFDSVF